MTYSYYYFSFFDIIQTAIFWMVCHAFLTVLTSFTTIINSVILFMTQTPVTDRSQDQGQILIKKAK